MLMLYKDGDNYTESNSNMNEVEYDNSQDSRSKKRRLTDIGYSTEGESKKNKRLQLNDTYVRIVNILKKANEVKCRRLFIKL